MFYGFWIYRFWCTLNKQRVYWITLDCRNKINCSHVEPGPGSQKFSDSLEIWHKCYVFCKISYIIFGLRVQRYTKTPQYITVYGEKFFKISFVWVNVHKIYIYSTLMLSRIVCLENGYISPKLHVSTQKGTQKNNSALESVKIN